MSYPIHNCSSVTDLTLFNGTKVGRSDSFNDKAIESLHRSHKQPIFYQLHGEGAYVFDGTGHYSVHLTTPEAFVAEHFPELLT